MITPEQALRAAVAAKGGFVNAHAHLDRANTIRLDQLAQSQQTLQEKWQFVDAVKQESSVGIYMDRIRDAVEQQRAFGTVACETFIDVDPVAEDRAITAAERVRDELKDEFPLVLANQVLKGVLDPEARRWFDLAAERVDVIGGLPEKDAPREAEHLDVLLATGKRFRKPVHVHVDQFNSQQQHGTELLAQKTLEHGMEGQVWAIHALSLAAQPQAERDRVYQLMIKAGLGVISCPFAWIDSPRKEVMAPTHNSIGPLEELLDHEIPVALGTDGIADIYKPYNSADLWPELRLAIESCHLYERPVSELANLVTMNARKALGLPDVA